MFICTNVNILTLGEEREKKLLSNMYFPKTIISYAIVYSV